MDQDATPIEQNNNIVQEVQELNQISRDPNYQTFSKTTYWHQQNTNMDSMEREEFQKEITEILTRIETILARIESLLEK